MKTSIIYKNIGLYRFVMSLLYKGQYYRRFKPIFPQITGKKVTELCFADTIIADYCKKNSKDWIGIDINEAFVKNAQKNGFQAVQNDIQTLSKFPPADICIICGSLYHFNENLVDLFSKMLACAPKLIISEPVINLSSNKGIIGKLAKAAATVKGEKQPFRFTEKTLIEALNELGKKLHFESRVVERFNKDIIIVINKRNEP